MASYESEPEKGDDDTPQTERFEGLKISETELLSALKAERLNSIGFEDNGDIEEQREKALEYIKGEMSDVPARKNRSSVVASDVADAIETTMPDLMEIFTGGEDVGTFKPQGPDDEDAKDCFYCKSTDCVKDVVNAMLLGPPKHITSALASSTIFAFSVNLASLALS